MVATLPDGTEQTLGADAILLATGAAPRTLPTAQPDGERILTWEQVYDLTEVPTNLIVVGSGVTGAEFASAYLNLGIPVTLVSSRDRVLPGEDADAAKVLEDVLTRRGMNVLSKSRMESVTRNGDTVTVTLTDGRTVEGSHCILALGSVPNTADMGLEEAGVVLNDGGFVYVDRVSRTSARGVYAAGDCTGVLMLASVAAMQGRIAMWHFLGDTVHPLDLKKVSSNVFTAPEIATVGWSQQAVDAGEMQAEVVMLPLSGNPRAKMQGVRDGFVKLLCRPGTGIVVGGVVVGPRASELIHPVSIAVAESLTADQLGAGVYRVPVDDRLDRRGGSPAPPRLSHTLGGTHDPTASPSCSARRRRSSTGRCPRTPTTPRTSRTARRSRSRPRPRTRPRHVAVRRRKPPPTPGSRLPQIVEHYYPGTDAGAPPPGRSGSGSPRTTSTTPSGRRPQRV